MTSHSFTDQNGREWVVGYDKHRGGYYANADGSIYIGHWQGVPLTFLQFRMAEHGASLDYDLIKKLQKDEERSKTWFGRLLLKLRRG